MSQIFELLALKPSLHYSFGCADLIESHVRLKIDMVFECAKSLKKAYSWVGHLIGLTHSIAAARRKYNLSKVHSDKILPKGNNIKLKGMYFCYDTSVKAD